MMADLLRIDEILDPNQVLDSHVKRDLIKQCNWVKFLYSDKFDPANHLQKAALDIANRFNEGSHEMTHHAREALLLYATNAQCHQNQDNLEALDYELKPVLKEITRKNETTQQKYKRRMASAFEDVKAKLSTHAGRNSALITLQPFTEKYDEYFDHVALLYSKDNIAEQVGQKNGRVRNGLEDIFDIDSLKKYYFTGDVIDAPVNSMPQREAILLYSACVAVEADYLLEDIEIEQQFALRDDSNVLRQEMALVRASQAPIRSRQFLNEKGELVIKKGVLEHKLDELIPLVREVTSKQLKRIPDHQIAEEARMIAAMVSKRACAIMGDLRLIDTTMVPYFQQERENIADFVLRDAQFNPGRDLKITLEDVNLILNQSIGIDYKESHGFSRNVVCGDDHTIYQRRAILLALAIKVANCFSASIDLRLFGYELCETAANILQCIIKSEIRQALSQSDERILADDQSFSNEDERNLQDLVGCLNPETDNKMREYLLLLELVHVGNVLKRMHGQYRDSELGADFYKAVRSLNFLDIKHSVDAAKRRVSIEREQKIEASSVSESEEDDVPHEVLQEQGQEKERIEAEAEAPAEDLLDGFTLVPSAGVRVVRDPNSRAIFSAKLQAELLTAIAELAKDMGTLKASVLANGSYHKSRYKLKFVKWCALENVLEAQDLEHAGALAGELMQNKLVIKGIGSTTQKLLENVLKEVKNAGRVPVVQRDL